MPPCMESTVAHTHPAWWLQLYAWADARKKELAYGSVAAVLVGVVVSYFFYHRAQREIAAGQALSQVSAAAMEAGAKGEKPEAYLKVAADYSGTTAAGQALLRAATAYFSDAKYAEAQTQFERFVRDYRESSLVGQAMFGVAACMDAQGKTTDAVERYRNLLDRRPNDNVIPQVKVNLGRIYEAQGKLDQAKTLYQEVTRTSVYGAVGVDAGIRLEALLAKHPELAEVKVAATNGPAIKVGTP